MKINSNESTISNATVWVLLGILLDLPGRVLQLHLHRGPGGAVHPAGHLLYTQYSVLWRHRRMQRLSHSAWF